MLPFGHVRSLKVFSSGRPAGQSGDRDAGTAPSNFGVALPATEGPRSDARPRAGDCREATPPGAGPGGPSARLGLPREENHEQRRHLKKLRVDWPGGQWMRSGGGGGGGPPPGPIRGAPPDFTGTPAPPGGV